MKVKESLPCVLFCSALLLCVPPLSAGKVQVCFMLLSGVSEGLTVLGGGVSALVKLSGSGRSGSRAGRGLESEATQPECLR